MADDAPRPGASLAFYTLLSIAPLLILVLGIAGLVISEAEAQGHMIAQIRQVVGPDGARAIETVIENAEKPASGSIGKLLIGLYLGKAGVGSAYGAAGSLVVLIVWVYYSSQIFFFGAEFTRVYTQSAQEDGVPVQQREEEAAAPPGPVAVPIRQPPGRKLALAGSFSAGLLLGMRLWKRNGKVAR
jgi:uncharacterized BrkB/YihY/UPF0761 family membrane protein